MNPARVIIMMWMIALAIVTYGHYRNDGIGLPPASGYFGSAVVYSGFGALSLIPAAGPLAAMFSVAWTFSLLLRVNGDITTPIGNTTKAKAAG